ncbi:hypothetical protein ACTXGL_09280 [Psychrobacter sp. T6-6]|uniref:hypothetical protein n=1 Tax=Psychrobacter sp. T6-6 TaxID=3457452 RepID=UPI003FD3DE7D
MTLSYRRFYSAGRLMMITSALMALIGCNNMSPTMNSANQSTIKSVISSVDEVFADKLSADYASADYDKRAQGYDWVGVKVRAESDQQIDIKVRSRSDIKKPTCHFDGKAILMGQDAAHGTIFQAQVNDSTAFFQFKDDTLTIDSTDKYALNYFCSGGGSLAGEYKKLAAGLEI